MYQDSNIVIDIKLRRLEWQENCTPKALLDALPMGRRKVGRPKQRWLDDLTKAGIKTWRLDRRDWSAVLREAKARL